MGRVSHRVDGILHGRVHAAGRLVPFRPVDDVASLAHGVCDQKADPATLEIVSDEHADGRDVDGRDAPRVEHDRPRLVGGVCQNKR
jgi:hypothetical protein